MQDATINGEGVQSEVTQQGLYQRGKYPSVIDTDDIVFEIGVQIVGNLNKEKLLDKLMERVGLLEKALSEAVQAKATMESKVIPLEKSNHLYVETNQKLDAELVKVRNECLNIKKECERLNNDLEIARKEISDTKVFYDDKIINIKMAHEKEMNELINTHEQENAVSKKKKSRAPKKRS